MSTTYIWTVILGMGVVNYLERLLPVIALSRVRMSPAFERWLSFVPVSVMAALVVGEVLRPGGHWLAPLHNPSLFAALLTAAFYWRTRSFMGATMFGIVAFIGARSMLGA